MSESAINESSLPLPEPAEFAFLLKLSDAIRPLSDTHEIQYQVCKHLAEALWVDRVNYAEVDNTGHFVIGASFQQPGVKVLQGSLPIDQYGKSLMDRLRSGETVIMQDLQEERSLGEKERQAYVALEIQSYIAVPIVKNGNCVALLAMSSSQPRLWSFKETFLLEKTAERTWEAVERARIEHALNISQKRSQQLFDSIDQGMCVIQMVYDSAGEPIDYIFIQTNAAFSEQTGLTDAVGKKMRTLVPAHEQFWFDTYARIDRTGIPERFEHKAEALNHYYEVYAFRIDEPEHHRIGIIFKDISSRIDAEQALMRADQAKDDFLAVVSHELRNPLNLIQLNAELLNRLPEANAQPLIRRAAETLTRTVKSLAQVVDDLLDMSRINTGKMTLNIKTCDLNESIQSILASIRKDAEGKAITLTSHLQSGVVIHADAARIEQVIWNLLSNALKFTPQGGQIQVNLQQSDNEAILEVIDSGIGIPPAVLPTIFDMFVQEDTSASRQRGGLGIGLALVKEIIGMHHGYVEASSPGRNQGSTFRVRLPTSRLEPANIPTVHPDASCTVHVLIIEDNQPTAELLAELLTMDGYEVDIALDGPTGLAKAFNQTPGFDLILSDIDMPGMDGFELAGRLRSNPHTRDTVIVAVTGIAKDSNRDRIRAAGFNDVIPKPVTLGKINHIIERQRLHNT